MSYQTVVGYGPQGVRAGLDWWVAGLKACLPVSWRQTSRSTAGYCLSWGRARYRLEHAGQAMGQATDLAALEATLAEMPPGEPLRVILASDEVLTQDLHLPAAVAENLDAAVAFELDRYSPLPAEAVYFAVELLGINPPQQRLHARLHLIPRTAVAPLLDALARLGRSVVALQVEGVPPQINLLPTASRPVAQGLSWGQGLLLSLAALLALAAVVTPLLYTRAQVVALLPVAAAARAQAEQVSRLRAELDTAQQSGQFLQRRKAATPQLIEVLTELTQLLPDDTWLQRVELQQDDLQIRGESASAAALIERLEASPLFAEVNFRSPVTREPRTGRDQFHLGMTVVHPEPKP